MQYLYAAYDSEGALLYVGISGKWWERLHSHERTSEWMEQTDSVKIMQFPDRESVEKAEKDAIERLRPPYNKQYNKDYENAQTHFLKIKRWLTEGQEDSDHRLLLEAMTEDLNHYEDIVRTRRSSDVSWLFFQNYYWLTRHKQLSCRNCDAIARHATYWRYVEEFETEFEQELADRGTF
jgi:hypothetical protein